MQLRGFGNMLFGSGVFLIAMNYLAAVINMPQVTMWPTATGRLIESYSQVGWWFTLLGIVAIGTGVALIFNKSGAAQPADAPVTQQAP